MTVLMVINGDQLRIIFDNKLNSFESEILFLYVEGNTILKL